jgi:hypothetical protein
MKCGMRGSTLAEADQRIEIVVMDLNERLVGDDPTRKRSHARRANGLGRRGRAGNRRRRTPLKIRGPESAGGIARLLPFVL